jgi:hypothetical protein
VKQHKQRMCIINPMLVEDIVPLAGGQADIMCRIGISWNSSLGERLRTRILAAAEGIEGFGAKFPAAGGGLDRVALAAAFLLPSLSGAKDGDEDWQPAAFGHGAADRAADRGARFAAAGRG